ncbi:putative zinc-binding metallopeptidase [Candidatus Peregrinibacteria bacterium]|nr:putative zinc-binding metallopeptidase [Candidatus Peregrinibacteria bacterium]
MLFKVFSLFLVIQFASFALWQGVQAWNKNDLKPVSAVEEAVEEPVKPIVVDDQVIREPDLGHVRFAARDEKAGYRIVDTEKKEEIVTVLKKLPEYHTKTLKNLILDYNPDAHRGLGGKSMIILRAVNMDSEEFFGVMIHEIGHNVDLGALSETDEEVVSEFKDDKKPIYESDPSLGFYRISWQNEQKRKNEASNLDFVSGYAMTDPFEDFAETYVYYVLHNKDFKSKTQTSEALLKKYQFMKNEVFRSQEFDTGEYLTDKLSSRPWDITVLNYDLDHFLSL